VTVNDGALNIDVLKGTKGDPLLCGLVIESPPVAPGPALAGESDPAQSRELLTEQSVLASPGPGPVRLQLTVALEGIVLSWPAPEDGMVLQETDNLAEPVMWRDVGMPPQPVGEHRAGSVELRQAGSISTDTAPQKFYRLREC
jgi:hypothetical protein